MLKKGICFEYEGGELKREFEQYIEGGFEAIELTLGKSYLTLENLYQDIQKIKEAIKELPLTIPSIRWGMFRKLNLTSNNKDEVKQAMEVIKKGIESCKELGAKILLIVPGEVKEDIRYDIVYSRALENLKIIEEYARKFEIVVGLENVENRFLLTPLEARQLIDEINSEYIKFYLDLGNIVNMNIGYPHHWIEILENRICSIHVKYAGFPTPPNSLCESQISWEKVMKALNKINYEGYVIAEISHTKNQIKSICEDMNKILNI